MKSTVACLLLAFAGLASATTYSYPRGCVYANGRCVEECPVGTLSYTIGCGHVTREATCRNSRPKPDAKETCGYSACHCVHPTVRNEATGQCVHLDRCPQAKIIHGHGRGGVPKIQRRPVDKHHKFPARPTAPVAPVAPAKPVAPTPPVVVAPTAPVATSVPLYNNNGYNGNFADYNKAGYGYNYGYNTNSAKNNAQ